MKLALVTLLFVFSLGVLNTIVREKEKTHCQGKREGYRKEIANILLGLTDELVEHLWTVHELGLTSIEHLTNLASNQGLTRTRGTVQEHA